MIIMNWKKLIVDVFAVSPDYYGNLRDILLKESINKKPTSSLQLKTTLTGNKVFYDNLFKIKTILNVNYSVFNNAYFVLDNRISTILYISYLQNIQVDEDFISGILDKNSDIYIEFESLPKYEQLRRLRGNINVLKTQISGYNEELNTKPNDKPTIKKIEDSQEILQILQQMVQNLEEQVYSTSSKINIQIRKNFETADYKNQIKPETDEVANFIKQRGHFIKQYIGNQEEYMYNYIHTYEKPRNLYYVLRNNEATGNLYPFVFPTFVPAQDIIIANYYDNAVPICRDIWDLNEGHNGVIIGMTGSGKSATSKSILVRNLIFKNRKIIIIDPQNEYLYATKIIGGQYINILQGAKQNTLSINIFDKAMYSSDRESDSEFSLKVEDVVTFLSLVVSTEAEKFLQDNPIFNQIATDVVIEFYKSHGIYNIEDMAEKESPTLDEFIQFINDVGKNFEQTKEIKFGSTTITENMINYNNFIKAFELIQSACDTLSLPEYKIFKGKTNIDLSSSFISFNTKGLSTKLETLTIFTIMNYVVRGMYNDLSREKILFIDEGWQILSRFGASYIKTIAKTARKFNMGLIVASQQLSDFNSNEGLALLENSSFAYIYKIRGDDSLSEKAKSFFNLTDDDIYFLKNNTSVGIGRNSVEKSATGILKFGRENYRIRYVLTDTELKFAESNPDKLAEIVPNEIIETRKKIQELETTIKEKEEKQMPIEYETQLITYYNDMIDTLREIRENIEGNLSQNNYNEENVRNFVINNHPIYSLNMQNLDIFGEGINSDEIGYLLQKGYKKFETDKELNDLFGDEVFYVKASGDTGIFLYQEYLKTLIEKNYSDVLIGQITEEQNDIIFKSRIQKENGNFYVYIPKEQSSENWIIKNGEITIEKAPRQAIFKNATNQNFIYVHDNNTKKDFIYPIEQENLLKDKIIFDEKRVQIRILKEYFTPFAEDTIFADKSEKYYVLFDKLYSEKAKEGSIPKNIFRYDEVENLLNDIFNEQNN